MKPLYLLLAVGTLCFGGTIDYAVLREKLADHPALVGSGQRVRSQQSLLRDRGASVPQIELMSRVDGAEQKVTLSQMIPRRSELAAARQMRENRADQAEIESVQREIALTVQLRTLLIRLDRVSQELVLYRKQEQLYGSLIQLMKIRSSTMDEAPEIVMAGIDSSMAAQKSAGAESARNSLIRQIESLTGPLTEEPVLGEPWRQRNRTLPGLDSSVMIRMASVDIAMSESEYAMRRSERIPDVMGMVQVSREPMGSDEPMWQPPMVGLSFSVPAPGRQKSRVESAKSAVESKKTDRETVRRELESRLAEAAESERIAVIRETNYRSLLIPDADRMAALQQRRYSTGSGTAASVLLALRQKTDLELMAAEESYMGEMSALMIEEMTSSERLRIKGEKQ